MITTAIHSQEMVRKTFNFKIKLNSEDPEKTNLPHIRLEYRREAWEIEKKLILQLSDIKEV